MTVDLVGHVFTNAGAAVSGATVDIFTVATAANESTASGDATVSTTTDSSGLWDEFSIADGTYDVRITNGTEFRWLRYEDQVQFTKFETANGVITSGLTFSGTTGTNKIVLTNGLADALSITDGSADIMVIDTSTAGNVITASSALTVGVDDTGHDVKFFGASAGAFMIYDESADTLEIRGPAADATTSTGKLLLSTALVDINANDVIGKVDFQAPLEAGGTDAITVAASIQAIAQATFSSSVNATDLIFYTGHSEAATEKFRFTSEGELGIGGATYGSSGDVLTSGGAGAAPTWATPTAGDITGVAAGVGLSGGGTSGSVTLTLDLSELSTVTPADGDFFSTLDSDGANEQKTTTTALATLLAGTVTSTGLAASSSVLSLDIQNMTASTTIADGDLVVIDDGAGGTLRKMTRANFIESAALDAINIDGGAIDGAIIGANTAAAITGTTIDAETDFTIGDTVITDGVITDTSGLSITAAATVTGTLDAESYAAIGNGEALDADYTLIVARDFTVASGSGSQLRVDGVITAASDQNVYGAEFKANLTTPSSSTNPIVAQVLIAEPTITEGDTVTAGVSLYVADAPTEGASNYALWVDAGSSRFDGQILADGGMLVNSKVQIDQTELVVSSGVVTITRGYHSLDTEGGASTDELDTINGGVDGQILVLRSNNAARDTTLTESGNLKLASSTMALDDPKDTIMLIYQGGGSYWQEVSRSNNQGA